MKKVLEKIKNWFLNLVDKIKKINWKKVFIKTKETVD